MAPDAPQNKLLKKSYRVKAKLEVFYTGGPIATPESAEFVVCPCADSVKAVELGTSAVIRSFSGDSEPITAVAVSPDGKSIFGSSRSLQTKMWAFESGECRRSWKIHDSPVSCLTTDSSGGLLASGCVANEVRVWDVEGGFCTHSFRKHRGIVSTVLFHPDPLKLLLFSGGEDGTILVYDLVSRSLQAKLENHFSPVTGLSITSSGWSLVSAGRDKVVNIFSLRNFKLESTVATFESLEGVAILPEGWGPSTGERRKGSKVERFHFVTVGEKGILRVWESDTGKCILENSPEPLSKPSKEDDEDSAQGFRALLLSESSQTLVCSTADQRLFVYGHGESVMGEISGSQWMVPIGQLVGNNDQIVDLRFVDKDEKLLAVATNSEQIRIYDVASLACKSSLIGHTDILLCIDFGQWADGSSWLASGAKDNSVRIWSVSSSRCVALGTGHMAAVSAVALSKRTNKFLVSGSSDRTIKVWNIEKLADGEREEGPQLLQSTAVTMAHEKDINTLAVSPNDAFLCSGSQDRTAKLWKLPDLSPHVTLRGHRRGIWSTEFSPVDQCVLTSSADLTLRLWAIADGSCLRALEGHTGGVLKGVFLSRGAQVASAGADGLVKLWTVRAGECVGTFDGHEDKVWALAVSPTTEMLATGGGDSLVNIWEDCTAADNEEERKKEEEELLRDQDLSNALLSEDYLKAAKLAFQLKRPFKMLTVFQQILKLPLAEERIQNLVQSLSGEELRDLLSFVREWNTNSKTCHVAQRVLKDLLILRPAEECLKVSGIREIIEGLLPYSERHLARADRLVRSTFLLDFTLASMDVLSPEGELQDPVMERYLKKRSEALKKEAKAKAKEMRQKKFEARNGGGESLPKEEREEEVNGNGEARTEGEVKVLEERSKVLVKLEEIEPEIEEEDKEYTKKHQRLKKSTNGEKKVKRLKLVA